MYKPITMKYLFTLVILLCFSLAHAQSPDSPDRIATDKGDLTVQPIIHGTLVLQWNGKTIYFDPYGGADLFKDQPKADMIFITDIHGDHLNMNTLSQLDWGKATFYVPQAVMDKLPENMQARSVVLNNGDSKEAADIKISAIPMYNLPNDENARHPKGRGNGYILEMGGKKIYISGDTEDIAEMRELKKVDVAFVCMNLPFTMDIDQAASAVLDFKPAIVYPFHYRGRGGLSDVAAFKQKVNAGNANIEVRLKNWYPDN